MRAYTVNGEKIVAGIAVISRRLKDGYVLPVLETGVRGMKGCRAGIVPVTNMPKQEKFRFGVEGTFKSTNFSLYRTKKGKMTVRSIQPNFDTEREDCIVEIQSPAGRKVRFYGTTQEEKWPGIVLADGLIIRSDGTKSFGMICTIEKDCPVTIEVDGKKIVFEFDGNELKRK